MKKEIKVSAIQMPTKWLCVNENLSYIMDSIEKVKDEHGSDLIVFPELSDTGYIKEKDKKFGKRFIDCTEEIPGSRTKKLAEQAKKNKIYVVVGLAEKHPEIPGMLYNSSVLIDPEGEIIGIHRKVHIPEEEKHYFMPGNKCDVFKTQLGNIGLGICYDGYIPEFTRILALKGAEIICIMWNMASANPINPPKLIEYMTSVRAAENRLFVISANCIGVQNNINFFGHSVISDPVGNFLAKAETEEKYISAILKEETLLEERAQLPVFRDRRPEIYSYLVKEL